ncbi:MAG: N-acetyltransferase [Bacilli bacterium]|jgi:predicted GNAT family acetyltransferase|nr:N-acetyltransferase [Bacilli bacterium]
MGLSIKKVEQSFQLFLDNEFIGEVTFTSETNEFLIIDHTYVDDRFNGKGYARMLVDEVVKYAKEKGIKIIPLCPYAKRLFQKHPETYQTMEYK